MRIVLILPLLVLSACSGPEIGGAIAAVGLAAVPIAGRSMTDIAISLVIGRDCSVVRLDQGKTYCRPIEAPPARPVFCTRTLGVVDCWEDPSALSFHPSRQVADGPTGLTPEQEVNRTRGWPGL